MINFIRNLFSGRSRELDILSKRLEQLESVERDKVGVSYEYEKRIEELCRILRDKDSHIKCLYKNIGRLNDSIKTLEFLIRADVPFNNEEEREAAMRGLIE